MVVNPENMFEASLSLCGTFSEVLRLTQNCKVVLVDLPIGLLDGGGEGSGENPAEQFRHCEVLARNLLPVDKRQVIFPAPMRSFLSFDDYRDFCRLYMLHGGDEDLAAVVFALRDKIVAIDEVLSAPMQIRILEGNSELTFNFLNQLARGSVLADRVARNGQALRAQILLRHGFTISFLQTDLPDGVARPDFLSACSLTLTACRHCLGNACCLPEVGVVDSKSLRMEIWY